MFVVISAAGLGSLFVQEAPDPIFFLQRSGTGVITADQRGMAPQNEVAGGVSLRAPDIGPEVGVEPGRAFV